MLDHNRSQSLLVLLFALSGFIGVLWLVWVLLAQMDFGYPVLYSWLNIEELVLRVGPQNHFKLGLELCSPEQHQALFASIVEAVHSQHIESLRALKYCDADSPGAQLLLRGPEVLHLQDVSNLISNFYQVGKASLTFSILMAFMMVRLRVGLSLKSVMKVLGITLAAAVFVVVVLGPVEVFYQLHEWIFPPDHPWFFYYQESLMTTLMKAPDIFGVIAALWLLSGVLVFYAGCLGVSVLTQKVAGRDSKKSTGLGSTDSDSPGP